MGTEADMGTSPALGIFKRFHQQIGDLTINWLVVWNIWIIFPYIGNHDPN
jgi:hypothetical protein